MHLFIRIIFDDFFLVEENSEILNHNFQLQPVNGALIKFLRTADKIKLNILSNILKLAYCTVRPSALTHPICRIFEIT